MAWGLPVVQKKDFGNSCRAAEHHPLRIGTAGSGYVFQLAISCSDAPFRVPITTNSCSDYDEFVSRERYDHSRDRELRALNLRNHWNRVAVQNVIQTGFRPDLDREKLLDL